MRIIQPKAPTPTTPGSGGGRSHWPVMPEWLKRRIEDKGNWVELSCHHKTNLNDRAATIIATTVLIEGFGSKVGVFCERCNEFVHVIRHMTWRQYRGITADSSTEPMF